MKHNLFFISLLLASTSIAAVDVTPFYRASFFQGEAKREVSNWTTHLDILVAQGSTDQSWNTQETKTHLFNAHGPFDMRKLAVNLENLANKPLTKSYSEGDIPNLHDGTLAFKGNFHIDECNVTLQQNICHGLYLQALLPIRRLKLDNIDYIQTVTTESEHQKLLSFVTNDLDPILEENGIKSLTCEFEETELADPLLSLGWHGHCQFPKQKMVTALRGFLQTGIIIPTGSRQEVDRVFSLPFGNNKHWGFHARANAHATLWKKIVLGANAGVSVFLKQTYDQRLTTSEQQNGWIQLEKGRASVDQGTLWDASVYAKAERIFGGLSFLAGYSYTQQEKTTLTLKDDCILATALSNGSIKSKNEVINSNKRLSEWYQHILHGSLQYDFKAHTNSSFAPMFTCEYSYPLLGKHSWPTDMLSGRINLALNWGF